MGYIDGHNKAFHNVYYFFFLPFSCTFYSLITAIAQNSFLTFKILNPLLAFVSLHELRPAMTR